MMLAPLMLLVCLHASQAWLTLLLALMPVALIRACSLIIGFWLLDAAPFKDADYFAIRLLSACSI
jgi:hypothetical protein